MSTTEINQAIFAIKQDGQKSFIEKLKALAPLLVSAGFLSEDTHDLAEINAASWDHFKMMHIHA
jgi:hypothetical protein